MKYVCLLRGINVGGKNKVSMAELKVTLEEAGFNNVRTYINSGNVFFEATEKNPRKTEKQIEDLLPKKFKLDSELIKIRLLSEPELEKIIQQAPKGFGSKPDKYHSDVLFPMDIPSQDIWEATELHPEVDAAWQANEVVYYQRLSAKRTKSRLGKVISKPVYKSITIRSWNTTVKLLQLLREL